MLEFSESTLSTTYKRYKFFREGREDDIGHVAKFVAKLLNFDQRTVA